MRDTHTHTHTLPRDNHPKGSLQYSKFPRAATAELLFRFGPFQKAQLGSAEAMLGQVADAQNGLLSAMFHRSHVVWAAQGQRLTGLVCTCAQPKPHTREAPPPAPTSRVRSSLGIWSFGRRSAQEMINEAHIQVEAAYQSRAVAQESTWSSFFWWRPGASRPPLRCSSDHGRPEVFGLKFA